MSFEKLWNFYLSIGLVLVWAGVSNIGGSCSVLYTFNMQLFSVHSVTVLILTRVHYQDFVDFSLPLQLPVMRKGEWVAGDGMSSSDRHDTVLAHARYLH